MEMIKELPSEELAFLINLSSYAKKMKLQPATDSDDREYLETTYQKSRAYACESIVSSLANFKGMTAGNVYHFNCNRNKFFILARVRTNWEEATIEDTAKKRTFLSFSVLTEKNLSHFPGRVIYGYHAGVTPSMIGYICPHDADTLAFASTRWELTEMPEEMLDIDDLCERALAQKTYCQLSIKSRVTSYFGPIVQTAVLQPQVVLAIGNTPTEDDLLAATQRNLPILILHPGAKTLIHVHDRFPMPELSHPLYL